MEKLVCDLCGSNAFTKDEDFFVCDYCRTKYSVAQAKRMLVEGTVQVDRAGEVSNLLILAKIAMDAKNVEEAFDYANRALEIDARSAEAWVLRGNAAGGSSSILNMRVTEMLSAFREAEKLTPEEKREELRISSASVVTSISTTLHSNSWSYTKQNLGVAGVWTGHVGRCQQLLAALDTAYEWGGQRAPLVTIVVVVSNLITGLIYSSTGVSRSYFLVPAYLAEMKSLLEATAEKLRKFDSSYTAPRLTARTGASTSACFVVTATMGNEQALPVRTLRTFRDQELTRHSLGRRFIQWYTTHGPQLAAIIASSRILRGISFVFLVVPATFVAGIILRARIVLGS